MVEGIFLPPGFPLDQSGPVNRFMPTLEGGSIMSALERIGEPGDLVVDPFGASPTLIVEAAKAGRAVIVAANNPITRFVIQLHTSPIDPSLLRAALARFANAPKDGSRLEPFLLDLYRTVCSRCGAMGSADFYIWDRSKGEPFLKSYTCDRCGQKVEENTTEVDIGLANSYSGRGLHYAMALEQLASARDPYRRHAETALNIYPGRSLYGLITLVSKLNQLGFDAKLMAAARALLLYAFDACNALWGYPEGRLRPRRLTLYSQYKETNVWRALEKAIDAWTLESPSIPLIDWPSASLPEPGTVAIYPGSARLLVESLAPGIARLLLTVPPRPNQAYWTLAALWAAWLWGRDAASPIKAAIRRRRYDWNWHARALLVVLKKVVEIFEEGTPALIFLPNVEPGFLGAALASLDGAGFRLTGIALRVAEEQAVLRLATECLGVAQEPIPDLKGFIVQSAKRVLEKRGEPSPFLVLHAAVWADLAERRQLAPLWKEDDGNPLSRLSGELEAALRDRELIQRLGRATELEHGLYWLVDPSGADKPQSDRVEECILNLLRNEPGLPESELFERIYQMFPGLLSPDERFVEHCLRSYAEQESQSGKWRLRGEDLFEARAIDLTEMHELLIEMGSRLGFRVEGDDPLMWIDENEGVKNRFRIQETAVLGEALAIGDPPFIILLPGGRAMLIMEKVRRDPRIGEWLMKGGRIIKYRHVRRLATEPTLTRENFVQRLAIDPPDHQDPQLPLL